MPVKHSKWVWAPVLLVVAILALPIVSILLVYKKLANLYLRGRILHGSDAFWALESTDSLSLSAVNILFVISGDLSLQELKAAALERLVPFHPKIRQLRKYSNFGYFYWKDQEKFNIDDYVEEVEYNKVVTEVELNELLSSVSNRKLPYNHEAGWEIILGPKLKISGNVNQTVILRIHHSIGDGPALFKGFIDSFTTSDNLEVVVPRKVNTPYPSVLDVAFAAVRSLKDQLLLPPDNNVLHRAKKLSGRKQIGWCISQEILEAAKTIRSATGNTFSACLLASYLAAVSEFGNNADKFQTCSAILPIQDPHEDESKTPDLMNSFSLMLVSNKIPSTDDTDVVAQLQAVDNVFKEAVTQDVLLANRFIVSFVAGVFPRPLAALALRSRQVTTAMSNMPGPRKKISMFGSPLVKFMFWLPNRDTTGVGASILSNFDELGLGIIIDEALLDGPGEAQRLAQLWKKQLLYMADKVKKKV